MHLEQPQRGETTSNITTRFDNDGTAMSLEVLGNVPTEVFAGSAPGPHPAVKVPFIIVRRKGTDAQFISLLVPSKGDAPKILATSAPDGSITVRGPGWTDTITLGQKISFTRHVSSAK
jgi:hypothetical protein